MSSRNRSIGTIAVFFSKSTLLGGLNSGFLGFWLLVILPRHVVSTVFGFIFHIPNCKLLCKKMFAVLIWMPKFLSVVNPYSRGLRMDVVNGLVLTYPG